MISLISLTCWNIIFASATLTFKFIIVRIIRLHTALVDIHSQYTLQQLHHFLFRFVPHCRACDNTNLCASAENYAKWYLGEMQSKSWKPTSLEKINEDRETSLSVSLSLYENDYEISIRMAQCGHNTHSGMVQIVRCGGVPYASVFIITKATSISSTRNVPVFHLVTVH